MTKPIKVFRVSRLSEHCSDAQHDRCVEVGECSDDDPGTRQSKRRLRACEAYTLTKASAPPSPEYDCPQWKRMKKRVDEIRDELGPEFIPAAAVERIMQLERMVLAGDRQPVSEWSKAERDEWLLDLSEAHWDALREHPLRGEGIRAKDCPLCSEYRETDCVSCPFAVETQFRGCDKTPYTSAVVAYYVLNEHPRCASTREAWRAACDEMLGFIKMVRARITNEAREANSA